MRPYRTLLEQKIRERRMTLEEFAAYAETFAREHGEPGTLSLRHLQRLVAGKGPKGQPLGPIRPATARLLERIFEMDSTELLALPMRDVAPPDDNAADLRERIQKARRVDAGMLHGLRDQLNTIRRIDRQYGAIVTHNELLAKISQTRNLFTHSLTANTRRELAILLSEMHALAGWQSLDIGQCSASWHHYEMAKTAALETGKASYFAHATAEQAIILLDLNDTATAVGVLDSTRAAENSLPSLLRAWLAAAHGETLAANGQSAASTAKFDEAEQYLSREENYAEGPYVALNTTHLARWRGHSAARSSSTNARNLLADALSALDSTFTRAESALRIDLAVSLNELGSTPSAVSELSHAKRIALNIGSHRQLKRIDRYSAELHARQDLHN